jgi:hypothetical protein
MNVRSMRPDEIDAAVSVWREANIARGAPHGPERTARIREKLSASDALPFVALRPGVVGMALAEPGRLDGGAGEPDPSLLHISMVFVRPPRNAQGSFTSSTSPARWAISVSESGRLGRTALLASSTTEPG